jgi:hypothetical protein
VFLVALRDEEQTANLNRCISLVVETILWAVPCLTNLVRTNRRTHYPYICNEIEESFVLFFGNVILFSNPECFGRVKVICFSSKEN